MTIKGILERVGLLQPPVPAASFVVVVTHLKGKYCRISARPYMKVSVGDRLMLSVISIRDAQGKPTVLKSAPVWTSSDPAILPLVPSQDVLVVNSLMMTAGSVTVTASADGICASANVDVTAYAAVPLMNAARSI